MDKKSDLYQTCRDLWQNPDHWVKDFEQSGYDMATSAHSTAHSRTGWLRRARNRLFKQHPKEWDLLFTGWTRGLAELERRKKAGEKRHGNGK